MTDPSDREPSSPAPPAQAASRRPRCRCGYDRTHYMVSAECKYTGWGWFFTTFVGASAMPVRAIFRCRQCGEVVEETEDPEILKTLI